MRQSNLQWNINVGIDSPGRPLRGNIVSLETDAENGPLRRKMSCYLVVRRESKVCG
jgi:hypothetical protein